MLTKKKNYNILMIAISKEGVFCLKDYLDKSLMITQVTYVFSTTEAIKELKKRTYHIIFLDLGKTGKKDFTKVDHILSFTSATPTVILSNELNMPFGIDCLERGASDYLIKDNLDTFTIYKVISHNIDRRNYIHGLEEAKIRYSRLFHLSPQPMWVYDIETLQFLDVNQAALDKYGYAIN